MNDKKTWEEQFEEKFANQSDRPDETFMILNTADKPQLKSFISSVEAAAYREGKVHGRRGAIEDVSMLIDGLIPSEGAWKDSLEGFKQLIITTINVRPSLPDEGLDNQ